jgi:excisionase family DNA binding protein
MTQKFYKTEEAAKILGVSPAEVNHMRESHQLRGYRDGMDWKFKAEDVDRAAQQLQAEDKSEAPEEEGTDVLLSEAELGQSESGASGTVIGASEGEGSPADSDIQLGDSDLNLSGSGQPTEEGGSGGELGELDLTLEEDLTLDDSQVPLTEEKEEEAAEGAKTGSDLDLAQGEGADEELVLGGSGSGSDITMGGDSGISLVDPADSGLSLEEPLELAGTADETLELGEDDMISLSEEADLDSPTELKAEEEFTLTPMEEAGEEEDSESGSQVIALDEVDEVDEGEAAVAAMAGGRAPMLDEDFAAEPMLSMEGAEAGAALGPGPLGGPQDLAAGQPLGAQVAMLPEAPYTAWNIASLVFCAIFLALAGMMMYDLLRNMWSWDHVSAVNSPLMDFILNLFGK